MFQKLKLFEASLKSEYTKASYQIYSLHLMPIIVQNFYEWI